jgi:hypothetical protein
MRFLLQGSCSDERNFNADGKNQASQKGAEGFERRNFSDTVRRIQMRMTWQAAKLTRRESKKEETIS